MTLIVGAIAPVFLTVLCGFALGRLGVLSQDLGKALTKYVFTLALPALVLGNLSDASLPQQNPWGYWGAYFGSVFAAWALSILISRMIFGLPGREAAMQGFAAVQSNTIVIGMPIILHVYGDAATVPFFLMIAVHLPVMVSVLTLMVEYKSGAATRWATLRRVSLDVLRNPIMLSLLLALALNLSGIGLPAVLRAVITPLGATAGPCALIGLGLALTGITRLDGAMGAVIVSAVKLLVLPLFVWVLAFHAFQLPPVWAGTAVLFAALPTGINAHVMASRYALAEQTTAAVALMTTVCGIATMGLWLFILHH